MSGPFRFQQEEARSPLDRSASPFSAGQPVSFKTNVNRAKTKKWVQAKKNAYDGDDWGEYDEYDEYGVNQEPQEPAQRYYAQHTEQPSRSFTDPSQHAPLQRGRRNSFDRGDEQRAFSSTIPYPQQGQAQYGQPQQQRSGIDYEDGYGVEDERDFGSSAAPPPLQTRISQVPANFTSPLNTQFPPRKSSIGQGESPITNSPRSRTASQPDKPLPFIRPADIYKRHQEERERASLDSSRPSLDSLQREEAVSSQTEGAKALQPMETVAEQRSEYLPDFNAGAPHNDKHSSQHEHPVVSPPDDQGLRSAVDQAFARIDDQRSVPPTPISNDSGEDLLRSNTDSTSGISPIMSRVPSSVTSALKNRNQVEGSTPAIAEEPSETSTPVSQPTPANIVEAMHHVPRKPSPGHSRNFSSSSAPRSGLATPTRGDSPARSPVLAPHRDIPEPKSALFATESNEASEEMEGGLQGPYPAYAAREVDIATGMKGPSDGKTDELAAAERQSQDTYLESHNAGSPIEDTLPRDRSESPSKGRVQALAGKFGEVASSRRGSTQSNLSRNSVQSWERSRDNSRAASPTKASPIKPSSPVKEFRPHLPGQWESYATTAMTPSDRSEHDRGSDLTSSDPAPLDKFDLTPTTAKRPVAEVPSSETDTSDPIVALRDAGAAMVHSIRTTVGLDDDATKSQEEQKTRANHGDVYLPRPLQLDRTITSTSSAPPTPPAKDTPESEFPPPPPLKERTLQPFDSRPQRPSLDPQLSTDPSAEDQESDRLRKEIVASLTPVKSSSSAAIEPNRSSLQPASLDTNRASSILPSEYDTYWAEEDRASPQPSQDTERNVHGEPEATVSFFPQSEEPTKPVILHRFSWEASNSQLQTPVVQAQATPDAEPIKTLQEDMSSSPTVERATEEERRQWSEGVSDSYFGPGHTFTVTKPEPVTNAEMGAQPSSPGLDPRSIATPSREHTRSPGLHVVNTELDPEAVDLPPRFSADHQQSLEPNVESSPTEKKQSETEGQHHSLVSPSEASKPSAAQDHDAKSPTADKPLGAREIATLNSSSERTATYDKTREYWATTDHGLADWLTSTLEANPDLTTQSFPAQPIPAGSIRHRHTGSLALFGKIGGSSHHDQGSEQHSSASAPVATSASSPTTGTPSGSAFGSKIGNQHMQLKGKDLLHTANVLSGKGMTSAKGLFAKGKSRFGREKVSTHTRTDSAPSSREVSEEPELVTGRSRASTRTTATPDNNTPERPLSRSATEKRKESSGEEKRKRRFSFSSQFRRASRSRSRPHSIAFPTSLSSVFGTTPKSSPPRELHHFLMGDRRPNSFHAPDSWDSAPGIPPPALTGYFDTTPPPRNSTHSRLGILPSPAKSAFSTHDKDTDQVPPVPPIPDDVAVKHYRRRSSQDSTSHKMLQSVIRHSTPPAMPSRHSTPSVATKDLKMPAHAPVFADDDTEVGAQERADDYKVLLSVSKGSFQPDMPTAESENLQPDGFKFGSVGPEPKRVQIEDEDDDDDQPPRLNHDPIPAASPSYQLEPFMFANNHMDVSDDDNDEKPLPGRSASLLPAPSIGRNVNNISPVGNDDGPSHGAKVASVGDTSFVLARQQTDDIATSERLSGNALGDSHPRQDNQGSGRHSLSDNNSKSYDPPYPSRPSVNGPATADRPGEHEGPSLAVDQSDQGQFAGAVRFGEAQRRLAFETEIIGAGDVSPASSGAHEIQDDDDATPKAEKPDAERAFSPVWFTKSDLQLSKTRAQGLEHPSASPRALSIGRSEDANDVHNPSSTAIGEIALSHRQPEATRAGESSPDHAGTSADMDNQTRRVSASSSQVVDAVQESTAFNPSRASWDHDNIADRPRPEGGDERVKMQGSSDLVTPVARIPRITQIGPRTPEADEPHNDASHDATPNGYLRGHSNASDSNNHAHYLQASKTEMMAPERSRSILSQISAMVSDEGSTPYSPTSTGRSTPSTIRRMQPDSSVRTSGTPAQIPEETAAMWSDRTPNAKDDDFDLYADHNGIVKDVRDETGQPLRLADYQVPSPAQHSQPPLDNRLMPGSKDEGRPRLSDERPMSFISGPADQDGKPQDQINQSALPANDVRVLPIPEQNRKQALQHLPPLTDTVHSANLPLSHGQPPNPAEPQQVLPVSSTSSKNILQALKSIHPSNMATNAPVASSMASIPPQTHYDGPSINNRVPQNGVATEPRPHDPQAPRADLGQPVLQGVPVQSQMTIQTHDQQKQGYGQVPRNQFELHQQMMHLRAKHRQPHAQEDQLHTGSPPPSSQQSSTPQEQPSSKPRLASVFKGFGTKAHQGHQQHSNRTNVTIDPSLKPLPAEPNRNPTHHSALGRPSLPSETSPGRLNEQTGSFVPPNRPPSVGQRSQFSQVSQNSTRVHPTDPNLDPRNYASPASFHRGPPQQLPPMQMAPPQPSRTSPPNVPEPGKKKRFSVLGALFGRSGGSGDDTKPKLSKEEKKAQKAHQGSSIDPALPPASQWPPQHQQHGPQQPSLGYYPPGQLPPHTMQGAPMGPQYTSAQIKPPMNPQSIQGPYQQRPPQLYQQPQQGQVPRQSMSGSHPEQNSAFLQTKHLAEEHQARQDNMQSPPTVNPTVGAGTQSPNRLSDHNPSQLRQASSGPPPGGYYKPDTKPSPGDQGVHAASVPARKQVEQHRQQEMPYAREASGASHAGPPQVQHQRQQSRRDQALYRDPKFEPQQAHQQRPESNLDQRAYQAFLVQQQQQQMQRPQEQLSHGRGETPLDIDFAAQQQRQGLQQGLQRQQFHPQQHPGTTQPLLSHRSVSGPASHQSLQENAAIVQRQVSSPMTEPRYEAPPIPAAYSHVSGAYVSPRHSQQQPLFQLQHVPAVHPSVAQFNRQYSDPQMTPISPQVSGQAPTNPGGRSHSDASTVSMVSPISQSPGIPTSSPASVAQRSQKPRMSSISEVHQPDRPWHLNFPEGVSASEVVRARHRQFMQEHFTAQQQAQAERAAKSPSPHTSTENTTPTVAATRAPAQGDGYRELLPRTSPQPYTNSQSVQSARDDPRSSIANAAPAQPTPIHPGQAPLPAAYPLPMSPDSANISSPVNPLAAALPPPPPPKLPHSPGRPAFYDTQPPSIEGQRQTSQQFQKPSPEGREYLPSPKNVPQYGEQVPDEAPPSYDGPGVPNDGMNKTRPEASRPPNITTDLSPAMRGRQDSRPRQASIGILQHPQPASMAASPQRSSADMGAESLRRQLLQQQEDLARMERVQRQQDQRAVTERERQEREAARARARELERSASGGGQVGSLRSVGGSPTAGWERRGSGSRPVFELPAVEDDEPRMAATSYPGQEWVPPMWDGAD